MFGVLFNRTVYHEHTLAVQAAPLMKYCYHLVESLEEEYNYLSAQHNIHKPTYALHLNTAEQTHTYTQRSFSWGLAGTVKTKQS